MIVMDAQLYNPCSVKERGGKAMEKTIGAYEARRRFGQLIEEAFYRRDHIIVERSGRPMAVIISIDDYERWQRLAKTRLFNMLEGVWQRTAKVPQEDLERDVEETLTAVRRESEARREP